MPKGTLAQIDPIKRDRVLLEAARLFAERGFSRADMAELAHRAGVAKGSLYNYFESKEDCYLFVCRDGLARYRAAVYDGLEQAWDVFTQLEHIFRTAMHFVARHPAYISLYLNVASAGMDKFAEELSREVEQQFATQLKTLLARDQATGLIRADLDLPFAAHMINGLFVMFLSSIVSRHHQIRLREYLDMEIGPDGDQLDRLLSRTMAFLRAFLAPIPSGET